VIALLLALLASPVKPTVQLTLWPFDPSGGPARQFAPATYEARVIFRDPGKVATCPAFTLEWDRLEGGAGWEETSCDPYAADEKHPDEYRPPRRRHTYRARGVYVVRVEVRGGDRRKAYVATREVTVLGPGEEDLR
jgi:hypothetical protein